MDRESILNATQGGLRVFQYYHSLHSIAIPDKGAGRVANVLRNGRGHVSIYRKGSTWKYYDHAATEYNGDCFDWVATYYGLPAVDKATFPKVLERIAAEVLNDSLPANFNLESMTQPEPEQTVFFTWEQVQARTGQTLLHEHFVHLWGDRASKVLKQYCVGKAKDGRTLFWYTDRLQQVRSSKLIRYRLHEGTITKKLSGGRRDITRKHPDGQSSSPCLFGEHLVPKGTDKLCAIVEAEDAAIACAIAWPSLHWLASGGAVAAGQLDRLQDCTVLICPDLDVLTDREKLDKLEARIANWQHQGHNVKLWKLMEELEPEASELLPADKVRKMDPRDYLEGVQAWKTRTDGIVTLNS